MAKSGVGAKNESGLKGKRVTGVEEGAEGWVGGEAAREKKGEGKEGERKGRGGREAVRVQEDGSHSTVLGG